MVKKQIASGTHGRVLLMDTITALEPADAGAIVITGSHGGASAAAFALEVPLALAIFNDAGVGKDRAGIVALDLLQARGIAAASVSHLSARIGDATDAWEHGMVSHANRLAIAMGIRPPGALKSLLLRIVG